MSTVTNGVKRSNRIVWARNYRIEVAMFGTLLLLGFVLTLLQPRFLTPLNIQNLLSQVMVLGIIAIGQTLVIITGGIDLSVGGVAAFSCMVGGLVMMTSGTFVGVVVMLVTGLVCGLANGILVAYVQLAPFIVTLGMASITASLTYVISDGASLVGLPDSYAVLGAGEIAGVRGYVFVFLALYICAHIFLTSLKPGRFLYAVGSNPDAARLSGVPVRKTLILPYALTGMLCALAMAIESSRLGAIDPNTGAGFDLKSIAAVVIGGASLAGGRGSVVGTVIGIFLIGVLQNGLNILGVNAFWQGTALGVVIILAVILDRVVRNAK